MFLRACLVALLLVSAVMPAGAQVRWLGAGGGSLVVDTDGFGNIQTGAGAWEGVLQNTQDPKIILSPLGIDADKSKYLYIKLSATSGRSLQVFFDDKGDFTEEQSVKCSEELGAQKDPVVYRVDLTETSTWKGTIGAIRLDLDGCETGASVGLYGIGVSDKAVEHIEGKRVVDCEVSPRGGVFNDRMAAWHETMVITDEMRPNSCVDTYLNDRFAYMETYCLAKLVAGIEMGGKTYWPASAKKIHVDDVPGGVVATYTLNGVKITTRIVPLLVGRDTTAQDGAAVLYVKTEPETPVVVKCGGGRVNAMDKSPRVDYLRSDKVGSEGDTAKLDGKTALLASTTHTFNVAVKASGEINVGEGDSGGEIAVIRIPGGSGYTAIAYAKEAARSKEIIALDPKAAHKQVSDYYDNLLQCRIETPEKVMDQAFRTAIYNLEYNWITPYGWNECIHHWLALWHMQHTGAEEWLGHADRSRSCNVTTAEHLLPSGAIPQFMPSGFTRRDFGGSNQFWAWQIRHYWRFTGDRKAVAQLAEPLDKVIDQTFKECDPDGDGLLCWGQQIGNQEDYVSTPFNGTSPSVEGINMLRTAAEFARVLGQTEKAQMYDARADQSAARLRSELWQTDLGRGAFHKDPYGVIRPDGQYHSVIYPVIWGLLDPLDSWTSIDQLTSRLMGARGECYCSNNFPNHVIGTWGMQTGVAQQPWAAWGLAHVGLRNETYKPLKAAAEWAMDKNHRGSWPEISEETTAAYFSPPAGLYIQSTIEALFGLNVNKPEGYLRISPSFPDSWPAARLHLRDYSASYKRTANTVEYTVKSKDPLERKLRWMLPPCRVTRVLMDGKAAKYSVVPGVDGIILSLDTAAAKSTIFKVTYEPVKYSVQCHGSIAEGDSFTINASGCKVEAIEDRCGVLSQSGIGSGTKITARVQSGLLKSYEPYGRLGQMNFSRRTFFLLVNKGGLRFWKPVTVTVLPKLECAVRGEVEVGADGGTVKLLVRNNSFAPVKGKAALKIIRSEFGFDLSLAPRSEKEYALRVPKNLLALLSPGDNTAYVALPGPVEMKITVPAGKLFESDAKLGDYARSRVVQIPLPEESLKADTGWREMREFYAYGHMPWAWSKPPLETLDGKTDVSVPGLPGVNFKLQGRKFVPVSNKLGRPEFRLDLGNKPYKKIYLLVIPFLDNHDTFTPVARVTVRTANKGITSRTLSFPGDLDWWCPQEIVWDFATAHKERKDRFGLLPMLASDKNDWAEAAPPAFPQSEFYATCLTLKTKSSVMNVVEIDLDEGVPVQSVAMSTIGVDPAFGIVAVSAESSGQQELLEGTQWMPPTEFREPKTVFSFDKAGDLKGWKTEGDAFSVAPVPSLFSEQTLNSLAKASEQAKGKAISPDFTIGKDDKSLTLVMQGGNSDTEEGPDSLTIRLIDSATGETLHRMQVRGSHTLREDGFSVEKWQGRTVHLELVDEKADNGYSWLGVKEVGLSAR